MKEEWLEQLKKILQEMEDAEDNELELAIEHLSTSIDEIDSIL